MPELDEVLHPVHIGQAIFDASQPAELRARMLESVIAARDPRTRALLHEVVERAAAGNARDKFIEKSQELARALDELQRGPMRAATFLTLSGEGNGACRAQLVFADGASASVFVHDATLARQLRTGDRVWTDAQARLVLQRDAEPTLTGEEARLERALPGGRVEVVVREQRFVYHAADRLRSELDAGHAAEGANVIVCPQRGVAFCAVERSEGTSHFRYLCKEPPPSVSIERDIADPPPALAEIEEHVRTEMTTPERARKYGIRRSSLAFFEGVSGSGKTLCIQGLWRRVYEIASEITGDPIEALPKLAFRLSNENVLSPWLGVSDKNLGTFFDEVEACSRMRYRARDGREHELPTLVILEEVDAWARERGTGSSDVYDRIQTVLLRRLDPNSSSLADALVIVIATSNLSALDPAFVRRIGGRSVKFKRLSRRGFAAVLEKHLARRPLRRAGMPEELEPEHLRRSYVARLTAWLFADDSESAPRVELTFAATAHPETRGARDLMTAALVDRAVQQAAGRACREEAEGAEPGIGVEALAAALDDQIQAIVERLTKHNVHQYLTLDQGSHVVNVRPLPRRALDAFDLQR